jgi:hypothetical protein
MCPTDLVAFPIVIPEAPLVSRALFAIVTVLAAATAVVRRGRLPGLFVEMAV